MNEIVASNRDFAQRLKKTLVESKTEILNLTLDPGETGALFNILVNTADLKHPLIETLSKRAINGTGIILELNKIKRAELIEILTRYVK